MERSIGVVKEVQVTFCCCFAPGAAIYVMVGRTSPLPPLFSSPLRIVGRFVGGLEDDFW